MFTGRFGKFSGTAESARCVGAMIAVSTTALTLGPAGAEMDLSGLLALGYDPIEMLIFSSGQPVHMSSSLPTQHGWTHKFHEES